MGMVAFSSVGAQNAQNNTNQSTQESSKPIIERHSLTMESLFLHGNNVWKLCILIIVESIKIRLRNFPAF